jgi:trans-2,3-dihydro-3-hydroxyanthranilate isomerase
MRRWRFVTLDVFAERRFGGNQLAVFPDARGMSDAEMQALASEFNFSETTFVLPAADAANSARVRIFNRVEEMPFAGHPMVGTGFVLADRAEADALRFEVPAGVVQVTLRRDAAGAVCGATIAAPQPLRVGPVLPGSVLLRCARVAEAEVVTTRHPPTIVSDGGNTRLAVEVTAAGLDAAEPDLAGFRATVAAHPELDGRLSLYLYRRDGAVLRARMFAPLAATPEDPATGSAATPLAGFLHGLTGEAAFTIHQGEKMGRPSLLHARAWRAADGIRASVGGDCVMVTEGEARLD